MGTVEKDSDHQIEVTGNGEAHRKKVAVEPTCWVWDAQRLRHSGIWVWKYLRGR